MYTNEQREIAVERFFSSGMSMQEVVDELGYPTRSSLGRWVREDPRYDPSTASRAPYTQDVRMKAAEMLRAGVPAAEVAEELGVGSVASIYNWARKRRSNDDVDTRVQRDRQAPLKELDLEELRNRCRMLERENEELREELDAMIAEGK